MRTLLAAAAVQLLLLLLVVAAAARRRWCGRARAARVVEDLGNLHSRNLRSAKVD